MGSRDKVLTILRRNNEQIEGVDDKEIKNMIMRMSCKTESEKVIIELYLLNAALAEVKEAVEELQGNVELNTKIKNGHEGINMIVGLRRDVAMMKGGLERVREKIERR